MLGELLTFTFILFIITILVFFGYKWDNFKKFFHTHYTFFKVSFVIIYFIEQVLLATSLYFFKEYTEVYSVIIGLSTLTIMTTVALQVVMMESINKKVSDDFNKYKDKIPNIKLRYERELSKLHGYVNYLENALNKKLKK